MNSLKDKTSYGAIDRKGSEEDCNVVSLELRKPDIEESMPTASTELDVKKENKHYTRLKYYCCGENLLLFFLLLSVIVGIILGVNLRNSTIEWTPRRIMYLRFPGEIIMRMLELAIVPLMLSAVVAGIGGLNPDAASRMGFAAVMYYATTTTLAVTTGIILVNIINPGLHGQPPEDVNPVAENPDSVADSVLDLIRNIFPDNILEIGFRHAVTVYTPVVNEVVNYTVVENNITEPAVPEVTYTFENSKQNGTNVIGLISIAIVIGITLNIMQEAGEPLVTFSKVLLELTLKLVIVVVWLFPLAILFLISAEIVKMEDPKTQLISLGYYILTVTVGLAIHGFITLPLIYFVFLRKNPYSYLVGVKAVFATTIGTASSAASIPIAFKCLEENNGISPKVVRSFLPIGVTINMDGTALYEAVAAIYIAQQVGMSLTFVHMLTICITATLASIGAAAFPSAGLITLIIVLTTLGIPGEEIGRIVAVDWLLDRLRTTVNMEGDCYGVAVIESVWKRKKSGDPLVEEEEEE